MRPTGRVCHLSVPKTKSDNNGGEGPRRPASTTSGRSRRRRGSSTVAPLALHPRQADDAIVRVDVDDPDAPRVATLRGHVLGREADQLTLGRHDQDVVALAHLDPPE